VRLGVFIRVNEVCSIVGWISRRRNPTSLSDYELRSNPTYKATGLQRVFVVRGDDRED
jgi:hypothetical protein